MAHCAYNLSIQYVNLYGKKFIIGYSLSISSQTQSQVIFIHQCRTHLMNNMCNNICFMVSCTIWRKCTAVDAYYIDIINDFQQCEYNFIYTHTRIYVHRETAFLFSLLFLFLKNHLLCISLLRRSFSNSRIDFVNLVHSFCACEYLEQTVLSVVFCMPKKLNRFFFISMDWNVTPCSKIFRAIVSFSSLEICSFVRFLFP